MQPNRGMTQNCMHNGAALSPAAADKKTFNQRLKQVLLMLSKWHQSFHHHERLVKLRFYTCKTQAWCTTLVQAGHKFVINGHIMRIQNTEQNNEKTVTPKYKDTLCEGGFNRLQFLYASLNVHIHCLCKFQISSNRLLQITDLTALTAHPVPRVAVYSVCCTLLLPLKLRMTEWKGQCSPAALCVELL